MGGGLHNFSVSPSPLLGLLGLELGKTVLGLGLGDWGLRGWGLGLDNIKNSITFIKGDILNSENCNFIPILAILYAAISSLNSVPFTDGIFISD